MNWIRTYQSFNETSKGVEKFKVIKESRTIAVSIFNQLFKPFGIYMKDPRSLSTMPGSNQFEVSIFINFFKDDFKMPTGNNNLLYTLLRVGKEIKGSYAFPILQESDRTLKEIVVKFVDEKDFNGISQHTHDRGTGDIKETVFTYTYMLYDGWTDFLKAFIVSLIEATKCITDCIDIFSSVLQERISFPEIRNALSNFCYLIKDNPSKFINSGEAEKSICNALAENKNIYNILYNLRGTELHELFNKYVGNTDTDNATNMGEMGF